jgi:hypothetical protein
MFTTPGEKIILYDAGQKMYVGIAYVGHKGTEPEFATYACGISKTNSYLDCMEEIYKALDIAQDMRLGDGAPIFSEYSAIVHKADRAMVTVEGNHYAVGVKNGKFHFAVPEAKDVSDEELEEMLESKMGCSDFQ